MHGFLLCMRLKLIKLTMPKRIAGSTWTYRRFGQFLHNLSPEKKKKFIKTQEKILIKNLTTVPCQLFFNKK